MILACVRSQNKDTCNFLLKLCSAHVAGVHHAFRKPGHPERVHSPTHTITQPKQVRPFERFLKINVKHITDGQVS